MRVVGEHFDHAAVRDAAVAALTDHALQFAAQGNKDASSIRTRIAAIQALANFSDQQTAELLAALSRDSVAEISDAAKSSLGLAR